MDQMSDAKTTPEAESEVLPPEAEMTDEQIVAALNATPDAPVRRYYNGKQSDWEKMPSGEQVMFLAEQTGIQMTDEQKAELQRLENDAMVKEFMKCGFSKHAGGVEELVARNLFSQMMMKNIEIMPLLMTVHYFNIRSAEKAVEFAEKLIEESETAEWLKGVSGDKKTNLRHQAVKIHIFAVKELSAILDRAQKLAQKIAPAVAQQKPRVNKPPTLTFNGPTQVAVISGK
jgi:hypothetical protein